MLRADLDNVFSVDMTLTPLPAGKGCVARTCFYEALKKLTAVGRFFLVLPEVLVG